MDIKFTAKLLKETSNAFIYEIPDEWQSYLNLFINDRCGNVKAQVIILDADTPIEP